MNVLLAPSIHNTAGETRCQRAGENGSFLQTTKHSQMFRRPLASIDGASITPPLASFRGGTDSFAVMEMTPEPEKAPWFYHRERPFPSPVSREVVFHLG